MERKDLIVDVRDGVASLTVNRPEVRNALDLGLIRRMAESFEELGADPSIRVFVLKGAGDRVFISGADIREFAEQLATPRKAMEYDLAAERLPTVLRRLRQPVIAMIQGHAIGAGAIIAASCDFRVSVRTAGFGIPVAKLGLFISVPDIQRLVHLIGPSKTKWLMMTGKIVDAPEAEAMGLVDKVVDSDDLEGAVHELTRVLCDNAPLSIKATKEIIEQFATPSSDIPSGAQWYDEIYASRDLAEGIAAFLEKRKAEFRGV